ncbi:MAG TPA: excinuclease ABC subunit UvrA [Candidatus Saccharicenans sp.]|jgi:excinuclease ABC subunit A|nr:excinuclease ABC subunit UvrA [Candidatus Saccharicenans sp.]HRD01416.1 excinuclease ABC subunit UvrA [Candidatus Saccharicenans sp.]
MEEKIILRGVRVHNLKNIDLDLPVGQLIVITGVSGSGKSSLAFDTLYAEGQRRYLESLSSYARQFLERLDRPEADLIEGIPPAIAIQQKASAKNPRSTVATVTEIYDYLRVLYAHLGTIHCLQCGQPVKKDTIDSMVETLFKFPAGTKMIITFDWSEEKKLSELRREGFLKIYGRGQIRSLDDFENGKPNKSGVEVVVDELVLDKEDRERLVDSLETGLKKGEEHVRVRVEGGPVYLFTEQLECRQCGIVYEEPYPNLFSFNSPQGACPVCHGFGDLAVLDENKIVPDKNKSLEEGAIEPWTKPASRGLQKELLREARKRGISTSLPFSRLKPEQQKFILEGGDGYYGVKGFFDWLESKKYKVQVRVLLSRYRQFVPCPACYRTRLNEKALAIKIQGKSIGDFCTLTVREAFNFFENWILSPYERQVGERLIQEIKNRLNFLLEVGLDYLSLDRLTFTLSGGEAQRINLAAALSASLVGTLFILDEPSVGLHPRDNNRLVKILRELQGIGNTVIVVEHDPEIIARADYIIDLGPGAGEYGGEVIFAGPMKDFREDRKSLTAKYIRGDLSIPPPPARRPVTDCLKIYGARKHNLKHLNFSLPLGIFVCITGVSGSGKSTLAEDIIYKGLTGENGDGYDRLEGQELISQVIKVDQSPLSTSPRSIPATYTKAMDNIRELFASTREAKALGYKAGHFSFNTPGGQCPDCRGAGFQQVEMQFLSDVTLTCETCQGRRYKPEILEIKYRGKTIYDVLKMSVSEALEFFAGEEDIERRLLPLAEVGLGYLRLGQPTTTLSGGELQRIKLAYHLVHAKKQEILYLFDEPTIGLHADDIKVLLQCFQKLVEEGNSLVVIEHNLDVVKSADYIIDLGPEGGEGGGYIVAQGSPEEVVATPRSITGVFLQKVLVKPQSTGIGRR